MADLDTQCAALGACPTAGVRRAGDGEWLCNRCGKLVARTSSRVPAAQRVTTRRRRSTRQVQPAPVVQRRVARLDTRRTGTNPVPQPVERTTTRREITHPCTTCPDGLIGDARWVVGARSCTKCAPLRLAAIGVHKSIPSILPLNEATDKNASQGRRRG